MSWIDTGIVIVIVVVALVILYKALKEPLDLLWLGIRKAFAWIGEEMSGIASSGQGKTVIRYGE